VLLGLLERHFDDQLTFIGHERNELVDLGVSRQSVRLLELFGVEITGRLVLGALTASNGEDLVLALSLDGLGRISMAVERDAVFLRNARLLRDHELGPAQPLHVSSNGVVQLIEGIEHVQGVEGFLPLFSERLVDIVAGSELVEGLQLLAEHWLIPLLHVHG